MKYAVRNQAAYLCIAASLLAMSSQARAEYKCSAPASIDRHACEAAKESPQALRAFIQRVKGMHSLHFFDYVNEARARAWAQNEPSSKPVRKPSAQTAQQQLQEPGA